jgi:hypothetical protein
MDYSLAPKRPKENLGLTGWHLLGRLTLIGSSNPRRVSYSCLRIRRHRAGYRAVYLPTDCQSGPVSYGFNLVRPHDNGSNDEPYEISGKHVRTPRPRAPRRETILCRQGQLPGRARQHPLLPNDLRSRFFVDPTGLVCYYAASFSAQRKEPGIIMRFNDGIQGLGHLGELAAGYARFYRSKTIEPEHLLLALVNLIAESTDNLAAYVLLTRIGVHPFKLWSELLRSLKIAAAHYSDFLTDGSAIAKVLAHAQEEMEYQGHAQAHTGHLLLGIIRYYEVLADKITEPRKVMLQLAGSGELREIMTRDEINSDSWQ